ncbi:putative baseplate assembly protein [Actinoplanes sp. NPDC049548]|uniref:putative baseplate assembly protein n=1 Tax=Actinoplanes sp. NPDC049548 TaxID=3155152 RepID=UPI003415D837
MTDQRPLFDDRRFPDLLDQARAEFRRRLADAGAHRPISTDEEALLASAALLVDHLHDRLGALSGRLHAPLLELLGLRPRGPRAAVTHVRVTFEDPLTGEVEIPAGAEITSGSGAPFTVVHHVRVIPPRLAHTFADPTGLRIGFAEPVGGTTIELTGVDATGGEFWDGREWRPCRRRQSPGDALWLEVPPGHVPHELMGAEAAWLRLPDARLTENPHVRTVEAVVLAVHARRVADEPLGVSDGTAGQRFRLRESPAVVPGRSPVVETSTDDGWLAWQPVESFARSRPGDLHVRYDVAAGEIVFPPAVPGPDGSSRATGPVPPPGALVRVRDYWTGGGSAGNVPAGALHELGIPLPGVRVENPYPARGGSDAESEADLWQHAPRLLAAGDRAVTEADHEELAMRADASLARVRCVADQASGAVQLLLVASPPAAHASRPSLEDLRPSGATFEAVRTYLDERRLLASRLHVMPPSYQGIEVEAEVAVAENADERAVRAAVTAALYAFLHPLTGGDDGRGWPFGEAVHESTIKKLLYSSDGVREVVRLALSPVDPATGAHSPAQPVISLIPTALPLSIGHRVRIVQV